jgi:4-hydroxybenzoate polyprenyltransferase
MVADVSVVRNLLVSWLLRERKGIGDFAHYFRYAGWRKRGFSTPQARMEQNGVSTAAIPGVTTGPWPVVSLLRPRDWIKNGFVLAPLIFSSSFTQPGAVQSALVATVLFCLASSAAYVFNDLQDLEADRRHPEKRLKRPLASGRVSPRQAWLVLLGLWSAVLLAGLWSVPVAGVLAGYIALNVAYSLKLKHVPVVDLFTVAAGFGLRVLAGAVAIGVLPTSWMATTTLCLALYLAAVKRRDELVRSGDGARGVLSRYTVPLLDRFAERAAVAAVVFYALFVITVRPQLGVTVPVVLFGIYRYSYIVDRAAGGESPTDALWRDLPLILTVLVWVALCAVRLWPN